METGLGRIVDAISGLVWSALPDRQIDVRDLAWVKSSV
jgi:hypothetical protein